MKKNKEFIINYMLKHTHLSRLETAKMFRVSTATIARWRKEIEFSKLFQEEEPPQNDTGKELRKVTIEEAIQPQTEQKQLMPKILTNPNISAPQNDAGKILRNDKVTQFECHKKCYFRRKLYEVGELFFNKDCLDMPVHFSVYDPANPVRTQMSVAEIMASVGH